MFFFCTREELILVLKAGAKNKLCPSVCIFLFPSITIFGTGAKWLSVLQERNLKPCEL